MAVYVDAVAPYPDSKIACFRDGACHMWADYTDELHAMARRIGLRREWCQNEDVPGRLIHYDLTRRKRAHAIRVGAIPATRYQLADAIRRART